MVTKKTVLILGDRTRLIFGGHAGLPGPSKAARKVVIADREKSPWHTRQQARLLDRDSNGQCRMGQKGALEARPYSELQGGGRPGPSGKSEGHT